MRKNIQSTDCNGFHFIPCSQPTIVIISCLSIPMLRVCVLFLQQLQSLCAAFCLLWRLINAYLFLPTFLFILTVCLSNLEAPLPANGLSALAASRFVAVPGAPAMPLVERVLGFNAQLTGSQAWLEAADVVESSILRCKVVATC